MARTTIAGPSGRKNSTKLAGAVASIGMTSAMDSSVLSLIVTTSAHTSRTAQMPR